MLAIEAAFANVTITLPSLYDPTVWVFLYHIYISEDQIP